MYQLIFYMDLFLKKKRILLSTNSLRTTEITNITQTITKMTKNVTVIHLHKNRVPEKPQDPIEKFISAVLKSMGRAQ